MNDKLYEQLMAYFDAETTPEERLRLETFIANSPESQQLLRQWKKNRQVFGHLKSAGKQTDVFVNQVMNRLEPRESYEPRTAGLSDFLRWIFPAMGYAFSVILVFMAFAIKQPVVSADTILLSRIPQEARGVFVRNASDISQMFATEER